MKRKLPLPVFKIALPRHIVAISVSWEIPDICPKCGFDSPTIIKDKNHASAPVGLYCPQCDTQYARPNSCVFKK
jgi:predicted RNA-binding Zn-ribbon protein involved in translation (DUF1610 family)